MSMTSYSSVMTGASFMLFEFRQVLKLKLDGYADNEIRKKVLEENIFQFEKLSSIKRGLPSLLRRANVLDETLCRWAIEDSVELAKIVNLYAILKTDRLFFEFMDEVIQEKIQGNQYNLENRDLNTFFTVKSEQDSGIAGWTESTFQKLKQVYMRILFETGILRDRKTGDLNRLVLDDRLKNHLIHIGDSRYVRAMGE